MFDLKYTLEADATLKLLRKNAWEAHQHRLQKKISKSSRQEGLYKQIIKTLQLLSTNPKHPGLHTHEFHSLTHPHHPTEKVFEAYAQNQTPGAYRVFWCYGPAKKQITIITITPHP